MPEWEYFLAVTKATNHIVRLHLSLERYNLEFRGTYKDKHVKDVHKRSFVGEFADKGLMGVAP
ncbi:hypothetical protein J42TS3_48850 [Paenibacillus vini]|uniref:Uncharacterized protein n=1 Tax=Paenibacillus vini TaxID=1476024 RepID=A0ABQ4MIN8_9BACL|nr:hypothetical protein J42TS3_48850 [Paenibacillus vini]